MPFVRVWIHFVWSTKNREPLLTGNIRQIVFRHIQENAREKNIYVDFINGYVDHVHCLVSLGANQTMQKIMQLLKGESSFWINQNNLCPVKFEWQEEYFAVSVSESNLNKVRDYIGRQEQHHKSQTFAEEFDNFLAKTGFSQSTS